MARGLTLMECLMASAVMAVAIAAIAQSMSSGQVQAADALHVQRAQSLATALMEEIIAMPITADGVTSTRGGTKTQVTSFHGFTELEGELKDASNTLYPTVFQKFIRSSSVNAGNLALPGATSVAGYTVTVTVSEMYGRNWTLMRFVPSS